MPGIAGNMDLEDYRRAASGHLDNAFACLERTDGLDAAMDDLVFHTAEAVDSTMRYILLHYGVSPEECAGIGDIQSLIDEYERMDIPDGLIIPPALASDAPALDEAMAVQFGKRSDIFSRQEVAGTLRDAELLYINATEEFGGW